MRNSVKVLRILEGKSGDQSSRVFDLVLANKSNAQIMLTKYEVRWRYRIGTAQALSQGVPLKPIAQ